jgi:hypothetical protein
MSVKAFGHASFGIGFVGGLVGIGCCVSPVVLYLVGLASATEAVSLSSRLYGDYAWYFRGTGVAVGGIAFTLYLRRRGQCDLSGALGQWRTIVGATVFGVLTYAALYGFTTWLGSHARG